MTVMHLATLITVLSAGFQTVSAGCFGLNPINADVAWSDRGAAKYHASRACFGYDGQQGAFQGYFQPGEEKRVCVNGPDNQRFDFVIKNENYNAGFDLGDSDCRDRLFNEIDGCQYGGKSTVSGWTFTSDPNRGQC